MENILEINSTLKIINEGEIEERPGIVSGQTIKGMVGSQTPTERISVSIANFAPGVHEPLHWHLTEVSYFVISGHAVMKDINGKTYELRPGSLVYAGPGIAGAHSWESKDQLKLLTIRATSDPKRIYSQFNIINEETKESTIKFESLVRTANIMESLY